jgi:clan AA aspartic protease
MGTTTMGKSLVTALIENLEDLWEVERGQRAPDQVRHVEVTDALVDTGASGLLVPLRLVQQLGLRQWKTRPAQTIAGPLAIAMYQTVRLTIQGRECHCDVGAISDTFSVIIGQIPLESLDWVVDPKGQRLIGNPEHGGEHMMDVL